MIRLKAETCSKIGTHGCLFNVVSLNVVSLNVVLVQFCPFISYLSRKWLKVSQEHRYIGLVWIHGWTETCA